ncbi:MAG: hypothetical protein WC683_20045 [bacterium]
MARRKLLDVEVARAMLDEVIVQEAAKEGVSLPALTRVNAVQEVAVLGATRLLTVDVSATHPLIEMGTGTLSGVMVRLRPTGLCTADDMDFAERCVRKAGALTVTRMPLAAVGPDADIPGEDNPPDEELSVLPMVEALDANLRKQLARERCSDVECEETMKLAHTMLEQAGG